MIILIYGIACYAAFLATILYAIGFVGNLLVPKAIDSPPTLDVLPALVIDLVLLALFALQHSVMARPTFKRRWTRLVPEAAERSTYVLCSSLALILLFALWQPLGGRVWTVENELGRNALYAGFGFGWGLVFLSTFLINHFDLFGLRQAWLHFRGLPYTPLPFRTPGPYRLLRHPLYLGFLFAFWCTPTMTVTHLMFALATTAYILLAIQFEEHDLVRALPDYADYRRRVPMLVPFTRWKRAGTGVSRSAAP
jgi:protein-S-isoprenylcysteine O-methyltransferase Ste14